MSMAQNGRSVKYNYHKEAEIPNIQHEISRDVVDLQMRANVINQLYHGFAYVRAIMY